MKNWLKYLLTELAALLLGIALTFAFAPYEIFPFAVLAPAGLLFLWLNATPKQSFWLGLAFGIGLFGAGCYWVYHSIHVIGEVPVPLSVIITSGMISILSLYPAFCGYIYKKYFPTINTTNLVCAFPNRDTYRQSYIEAWDKYKQGLILEPLECQLVEVINRHPEFHYLFEKDITIENEYAISENPFLHLSLHLALDEQLKTNRPKGITSIRDKLLERYINLHDVEHLMMSCIAEILKNAQIHGITPNEATYKEMLLSL